MNSFFGSIKTNLNMKKTINTFCYIISSFCWIYILCFSSCTFPGDRKYKYSGIIVDKGYEEPTSGHKSSTNARYYIMMKEDSSGKVIRINVTIPTWYSLDKDDRTTFELSNWHLYYNGNTTDCSKNLYGK